MKKYLTVAAVLGAIAFVSVSYLAQATEPAVTTSVEVTTEAPVVHAEGAVDAAVASDCAASVTAAFEGKTATDEEKAAALKACEDSKSTETTTEVAPSEEGATE